MNAEIPELYLRYRFHSVLLTLVSVRLDVGLHFFLRLACTPYETSRFLLYLVNLNL